MAGTNTNNNTTKMKCKSNRPSKYKRVKPSDVDNFSYELALQTIATKLETIKANSGGLQLPYGAVTDVVKEMQPTYTWLTKDMVRDHLKTQRRKKNRCTTSSIAPNSTEERIASSTTAEWSESHASSTTLSTLSRDSGYSSIVRMADESIANNLSETTMAGESVPTGQQGTHITTTSPVTFGRPKGSTQDHSLDVKRRIRLATAEAAKLYSSALDQKQQCSSSRRLPKGTLLKIIESTKSKYNLPTKISISESTIRSRHKRGSHNPETEQGTPSPIAPIEPYLVAMITQLSRMRQPINSTTGLHLMNSMIEGTPIAQMVDNWKLKHNVQTRVSRTEASSEGHSQQSGAAAAEDVSQTTLEATSDGASDTSLSILSSWTLGAGYWRGFLKRNHHAIRSKRAVKFEVKRAEWCTYDNFLQMYEGVYKEMAECGIASRLETKVRVDKKGSIVELEEESFGLPTKYLMQRPDKLLFVDEVGSNTSTTKDGNIGGEKFLCERFARPQIKAATKDSHFTVLGFTAATGEPVMCAVIFAAKELRNDWVLGYNGCAPWIGNEADADANTGGFDKRFPMGPV